MKYNTTRADCTVDDYLESFVNKYTFPSWQRDEGWSRDYKEDLIFSILDGVDIPKIYIAKIKGTKFQYIMDGGHRSRAILEFKNNVFPLESEKGKYIYYDKKFSHNTRNNEVLSNDLKEQFNNFPLTIVTYNNIEETDCKNIFNRLQNARPMDIEDVINSDLSPFVDFIRELINYKINSKTITEHFENIQGLSEARTKVMTQLISWFSIIYPNQNANEPWENALKYINKGNKNKSPLLDFIKKKKTGVTENIKNEFIEHIEFIFNYIDNCPNKKIAPTDLNTLIHSRIYVDNFNINKFNNLIKNVDIYKNMKSSAEKLNKDKKYDESKELNKQADIINSQLSSKLENYMKARRNGGNAPSGMKTRLDIVRLLCIN